jgi:hypothetical protein
MKTLFVNRKTLTSTVMLIIVTCLLSACVSAEKYNAMIGQWIGQSEDALVAAWGAPKSAYETDQAKYLTYENIRQNIVPPTPSTSQVIRQGDAVFVKPIPGSPGYVYTSECRTTFTVQNKKITNVSANGSNCVL